MEIEVGEYVRTRETGHIGKIVGIIENFVEIKIENGDNVGIYKSSIKNHSFEPIDLIEVGDYVNGSEVLDKYIPKDIWEPIELRINDKYTSFLIKDDIKSIVTKEQFKNIEYRLED